ncbi:MAG: response regulator [Methylococcales bacterium]|nr:response regulator [Methylococcales bacterium]
MFKNPIETYVADVLVVDDTLANLQLLTSILKEEGYKVRPATSGAMALQAIVKKLPDLILLDIKMPDMTGYEVCEELKRNARTKDIPIIFISALSDVADKVKAFSVGGVDYINKPFQFEEVKARVSTHLKLKAYQNEMAQKVAEGIQEISGLNQEIIDTQRELIFTMGEICETRSLETGKHVKRVAEYSYLLANLCGCDEELAMLIQYASPMHDIGKVAIADAVLNAQRRLTVEEFDVIKTHTTLGFSMLSASQRQLLRMAATIALEHHEKWDGTGYPYGIAGEKISLPGRITAIADVFDALGSERCYKLAWDLPLILNYFREQRGEHFDPILLDLFFEHLDKFLVIRDKFLD